MLIVEVKEHAADIREYRVRRPTNPWLNVWDILSATVALLAVANRVLFSPSNLQVLLLLCPLLFCLQVKHDTVTEESMLVIKELGVQLQTTYLGGREKHRFIEKAKIKNIIINEGFTMCTVIFYLCILVEGQRDMTLPFEHLFPRLYDLQLIYGDALSLLFGSHEAKG
eukprot:gb/GEZN01019854.1/.p1 GENE.gb/GEZN01019854.1/~~gb/GEZN01019854.1/.p1  ORF type:complete len:168 (-),score=14.31 gb/GEZN01019854.1/:151-654(-)